MKKLLTSLVLATTLILTSCSDGFDDKGLFDVAPGLEMYKETALINGIGQDGVSTLFRFAILMEEMKERRLEFPDDGTALKFDDLEDFTFTYLFNNRTYNIKEFLFGKDKYTSISQSVTNQNVFYIRYGNDDGNYGKGIYDEYYKNGTYEIDTKGTPLNEPDASWEVSLSTQIDFANGSGSDNKPIFSLYQASGWVNCYGVGNFGYAVENVSAENISSTNENRPSSDWSISGELTVTGLGTKAYNLANTIEADQTLDLSSAGDTLSGVAMSYTSTSAKYNPSVKPFSIILGKVKVEFTGKRPDSYAESAMVEFLSADKYMVEYNGHTYYN